MTTHQPNWTVVSVTGDDAAAFLHNFCTNDIKRLADGELCEAFFTNVKGHIVSHALVCRTPDGYRVVVTSANAQTQAEHLERYHIREDVEISLSDDAVTVELEAAEGEYFIAGLGAKLRFDNSAAAGEQLDPHAFETYRIERGFPVDGVDIDASRLPQEVNRNELAISFTKGCYLGQETVARIDALGHVNRKLVSVKFGGPSAPSFGTPLTRGDKQVGEVTSACYSERISAPLALAYVRREHCEAGSQLESSVGPAVVLAGPVIDS